MKKKPRNEPRSAPLFTNTKYLRVVARTSRREKQKYRLK